uniref:Putative glycosyltransferase n=1 Tax=viral metagenome TaxID=1070528 RepID=A0A6M3L1J1_9ZZZZ
MHVRGITKIRNEEHIIRDTLDNWAEVCDAIHVYDDNSTDGTAEVARNHPAVIEVISSNLLDPDRLRAEWFNRQAVLSSAKRFNPDWIAYFDGDEHLYEFDKAMLEDPSVSVIATQWHDMYITPEDESLPDFRYKERRWCGVEYRQIPFFYRDTPYLSFTMPDQRIMHHERKVFYPVNGVIQHWGKGFSDEIWERKVAYYGHVFGKYAEKWRARKGKAVHRDYKSDDGNPLLLWEDIRARYRDREEKVVVTANG